MVYNLSKPFLSHQDYRTRTFVTILFRWSEQCSGWYWTDNWPICLCAVVDVSASWIRLHWFKGNNFFQPDLTSVQLISSKYWKGSQTGHSRTTHQILYISIQIRQIEDLLKPGCLTTGTPKICTMDFSTESYEVSPPWPRLQGGVCTVWYKLWHISKPSLMFGQILIATAS